MYQFWCQKSWLDAKLTQAPTRATVPPDDSRRTRRDTAWTQNGHFLPDSTLQNDAYDATVRRAANFCQIGEVVSNVCVNGQCWRRIFSRFKTTSTIRPCHRIIFEPIYVLV